jgi:hypothetical protein
VSRALDLDLDCRGVVLESARRDQPIATRRQGDATRVARRAGEVEIVGLRTALARHAVDAEVEQLRPEDRGGPGVGVADGDAPRSAVGERGVEDQPAGLLQALWRHLRETPLGHRHGDLPERSLRSAQHEAVVAGWNDGGEAARVRPLRRRQHLGDRRPGIGGVDVDGARHARGLAAPGDAAACAGDAEQRKDHIRRRRHVGVTDDEQPPAVAP